MIPAPDKSKIREKNLARREAIAPRDHAAWSRACCEFAHQAIRAVALESAVIAGYAPVKAELDIMPALLMLAKDRHTIALPVIAKEDGRRQLAFHPWKPGEKLTAKTYGILEPGARRDAVIPDIVLVPLLAFDRRGHRLGYGGGYYDTVLRKLRAVKPDALTIGVGFCLQEEATLPDEAYDQPLNKIVTEKGVISIR